MKTKLLISTVIFSLGLPFVVEASAAYYTDISSVHAGFTVAECFNNCGGEGLLSVAAPATPASSTEPLATPLASPSPSAESTVMPTPTTAPQPDVLAEFENNDDQTGSYIDEESPVPDPTETSVFEEIITP